MTRLLTLIRHAVARFRVYRLTIQLSDAINRADCQTEEETRLAAAQKQAAESISR